MVLGNIKYKTSFMVFMVSAVTLFHIDLMKSICMLRHFQTLLISGVADACVDVKVDHNCFKIR